MRDTLLTKLEHFAQLSTADRRVLATLALQRVHHFGPHEDIMREGECPASVNLVRDGWACRYKTLEDGRRQIMAFLLPGDVCDLDAFLTHATDHSIAAITPVTLAQISRDEFDALSASHPQILEALRWASMVDNAIQREWTVNLGQRDASERLAHLLCELFVRLETAGLTAGDACDFPLTQSELGEATGLSTVHVNRTLRELRDAGLIVLRDRTLRIPDLASLQRRAMFNANYLHLDRERRDLSPDLH